MAKEDLIEVEGTILEALPNARFKVKLENGYELVCYASGKIRKYMINIIPGDKVTVAVSTVDPTKGRIMFRERK